jgi:Uma2 family endonuclease
LASNPVSKLTEEQYLAIERAAEFKSEFLDGEMFAMSGVSMRHSALERNILGELYNALRGRECEVFPSNLRVRVSSRMYTYPDISVVCGKPVLADEHQDNLLNPAVIFEILSPSTEKYDRGVKFQHYRTIESLREYILVDQSQVRIECYSRQPGNTWTLRDYQRLEEELVIDSVGVSIPLSRIYDRVELSGLSESLPATS